MWVMSEGRGMRMVGGEIAIQELHARHVLRWGLEQQPGKGGCDTWYMSLVAAYRANLPVPRRPFEAFDVISRHVVIRAAPALDARSTSSVGLPTNIWCARRSAWMHRP
jgi:hypothetical protein